MNEQTFTTGPWELKIYNIPLADTGDYEGIMEIKVGKKCIAQVFGDDDSDEANARLISAAPDLYEALKIALEVITVENLDVPLTIDIINAALAKVDKLEDE